MDDLVNINFKVLASGDIKKIAGLNKLDDYVQKTTFSIQFDQLNLMQMRRKIHLLLAGQ